MIRDFHPDGGIQNYFGLYPAIVTDLVDPEDLGRIEVKFPWLGNSGDQDVRAWATLLSPYADNEQGLQILPEKDSQVVVGFEAGHLRRPYIVGACWNGKEKLPEKPSKPNDKRLLKTRSGHLLEFDDKTGAEQILIKTQGGHEITLKDEPTAKGITVKTSGGNVVELKDVSIPEITIRTPQKNLIKISDRLEITVSVPIGKLTVNCLEATMTCVQATINASALLNVTAPFAQFAGVVKASAIVGSAYTPAPGNTYGL